MHRLSRNLLNAPGSIIRYNIIITARDTITIYTYRLIFINTCETVIGSYITFSVKQKNRTAHRRRIIPSIIGTTCTYK